MEENKSKPSLADGLFESKPKGCGHKNKVPKPELQPPPTAEAKHDGGRGMKTAALYARVSTLDQNCEVQLQDLRRYAGQRFDHYSEYIDVGVSGAQRHRPQLDALMKNARRRQFDVVLVWKFDRFARSLKQLIESLDEFSSLGIDFVSYTEGVDTTTPTGQLLFHIVGAVAQFERDLIAERVRAGLAHARAMGKHIGRPRAKVDVDAVKSLRSKGNSLRVIATTLAIPVSRVRRALVRGGQ